MQTMMSRPMRWLMSSNDSLWIRSSRPGLHLPFLSSRCLFSAFAPFTPTDIGAQFLHSNCIMYCNNGFSKSPDLSADLKVEQERAILNLMRQTGREILQENGQRKLGPPPDWTGPPPPKGCEVFVGHLPRYVFEDELVPIFSRIGLIYQLRLMMDFR